jgi:exodeoxyribonuclease III
LGRGREAEPIRLEMCGMACLVKVATWNINSVRARIDRLLDYLRTRSPDVLCLQETKCTDAQFPLLEIQSLGYRAELFGQKSYNGVAILSRHEPTQVSRSLGDGDEQARVIAATVGEVRIVGIYAPNGQSLDSPAYHYKLEWYARLSRWLLPSSTRPLVVCGDFNVAPEPIDTWDPRLWHERTLCSTPERAAFRALCEANQLTDLLRHRQPTESGLFTWWDYRASALKKNQGLRIDHLLVSSGLVERCRSASVDRPAREGALPSDHAPVEAEFTI